MCLLAIWRNVYLGLPFFDCVVWFFDIELHELFVENGMEIPQKTKNRTIIQPTHPTIRHILRENYNSK